MFEFENTSYFYLLAIVGFFVALFLFGRLRVKLARKKFAQESALQKLIQERSTSKTWLKAGLFLLGLSAVIIALVNPKVGTKTETAKRQGIDIVFALDVSKSMLCEDVAPNRLEKSKQIISQIMNQLGGDRVGLVAYAGSAFPVLPITSDFGVARMFLQSANPTMVSSQGTSLDDAIRISAGYFEEDSKVNKLLILISDGEDHSEGASDAAEEANKIGLKILTIGVGTEQGGPIPLKENGITKSFQRDNAGEVVTTKRNEASLKEIADATNGAYVNGNETKATLEAVKAALDNIEKSDLESKEYTDFNSQFQWFIGLALLLLFIDFLMLERTTAWLKKLNLFNE